MWRYTHEPIERYRRTLSILVLLVKNPLLTDTATNQVIDTIYFVRPSILLFIHLSIRLSIHLSSFPIHSSIYLSIYHPSIHSSIHPLIYFVSLPIYSIPQIYNDLMSEWMEVLVELRNQPGQMEKLKDLLMLETTPPN